jgi:hypothetical protein
MSKTLSTTMVENTKNQHHKQAVNCHYNCSSLNLLLRFGFILSIILSTTLSVQCENDGIKKESSFDIATTTTSIPRSAFVFQTDFPSSSFLDNNQDSSNVFRSSKTIEKEADKEKYEFTDEEKKHWRARRFSKKLMLKKKRLITDEGYTEKEDESDQFTKVKREGTGRRVNVRLLVPKEMLEAYIKKKDMLVISPSVLQQQVVSQRQFLASVLSAAATAASSGNNGGLNRNYQSSSVTSLALNSNSESNNFSSPSLSQLVLKLTEKQAQAVWLALRRLLDQNKITTEEYKHLQRMIFSYG